MSEARSGPARCSVPVERTLFSHPTRTTFRSLRGRSASSFRTAPTVLPWAYTPVRRNPCVPCLCVCQHRVQHAVSAASTRRAQCCESSGWMPRSLPTLPLSQHCMPGFLGCVCMCAHVCIRKDFSRRFVRLSFAIVCGTASREALSEVNRVASACRTFRRAVVSVPSDPTLVPSPLLFRISSLPLPLTPALP